MVAIKTSALNLILATLATASPLPSAEPTNTTSNKAPAAQQLVCTINRNTALTFTERQVRANLLQFPDATGASVFPHYFSNYEHFFWDYNKPDCDAASLLEMPVFTDGHLYDWDRTPRPGPGPVRLVYFADGDERTFCGLIAHRAEAEYFEKCAQA
ncbi:Ribonuclease/ribotoxin [Coniochaeta sp. 2T2.1]|nr:Ribonuclease/ribotoxin [Coniochaeta sp. 2T2.1]